MRNKSLIVGSLSALALTLAAGVAYDAISPGAPLWLGAILFALAAVLTLGIRSARGARPS